VAAFAPAGGVSFRSVEKFRAFGCRLGSDIVVVVIVVNWDSIAFTRCTSCWWLLQKIFQPIMRSKQTLQSAPQYVIAAAFLLQKRGARNHRSWLESLFDQSQVERTKRPRSTRVKTAQHSEQRNFLAKKAKVFLAFSKENLA
jgi:hypothetical protein